MRGQIDSDRSVKENIAGGQEYVTVGGCSIHVMGYLQDFLFEPSRALVKAGMLSSGERNRLLLAKLFTQPGNVLVLDEPTNDLDVETLELIENLVVEFAGAAMLVSHDRELLDHVAGSVLAIGADGSVEEFVGGYSDWKRQSDARRVAAEKEAAQAQRLAAKEARGSDTSALAKSLTAEPSIVPQKQRKYSFKDQREKDELPAKIDALEKELATLATEMASPNFYKKTPTEIAATQARHAGVDKDLLAVYARWEELEG